MLGPLSRGKSEIELLKETADLEYLYVFHGNGFCREVALQRINGPLPGPFFVVALIRRLNDWVPQVRHAAAKCLLRTAGLTDPRFVSSAALHLLVRIESWRRWGDESEALDEVLASPDIAQCLAADIAASKVGAMSRALRGALRRPALDPYLPSLLRDAHQPAVRAVALGVLLDAKARWPSGKSQKKWIDKSIGLFRYEPIWLDRPINRPLPIEALLEIGASDRSAAVRKIAASGLIAHFDALPGARALAQRLAGDSNPAVRERARFALDRVDRKA
jgi:HEAT repeat protein